MARLTTKERDKLPKSDYALPGKIHKGPRGARKTRGAYPIEDKAHARNALSRVSQHGTPKEKAEVRRKVHKKYPSIGKDDHHPRNHAEFEKLGRD